MQIDPKEALVPQPITVDEPNRASGAAEQGLTPRPSGQQDVFRPRGHPATPGRTLPTDPANALAPTGLRGGARPKSRARRYVIDQEVKAVEIAPEDRKALPTGRPNSSLTEAVTTSEITNHETQTNKARLYFRRTSFCEPSETYIACGKSPVLTKQQWHDVHDTPVDIQFSNYDTQDVKVWEWGFPYIPVPFPVRTTLRETNYAFTNETLTQIIQALGVDVSKVKVIGYENVDRKNALEILTESHGSITLEFNESSISQYHIRVESHESIPPGLAHHFKLSKRESESGKEIDMVGRAWDGFRWDYVRHPGGEPVRLTKDEVEAYRDVPTQEVHEEFDRYGAAASK